jgi:hypothetical protein
MEDVKGGPGREAGAISSGEGEGPIPLYVYSQKISCGPSSRANFGTDHVTY